MLKNVAISESIERKFIKTCSHLVKNSIPFVTSSVALMLMSTIDTLFAARMGTHALSAQALASVIYMTFFMGLAAFIFPLSNLAHLNPKKSKHYLKAGLLIVWILALFITVSFWFFSSFIKQKLLPPEARELFHEYFIWSSLRILPGVTFIYLRMLIYTLSNLVQITGYMFFVLIINVLLDFIVYSSFNNPLVVMALIAIGPAFLFLLLCFLINNKIPENNRLSAILLKSKIHLSDVIEVCKSSIPSMLTSFFEFLFFCVIGVIVAKFAYEELGFYRIVVQIEELFVLFFYSLTVVISIEFSKNIENKQNLFFNSLVFMSIVGLASLILYIGYPFITLSYGFRIFLNEKSLSLFAIALLIAECLMLLCLSYLRAMARNTEILGIVTCINWFVSIPITILLHLNNILEFVGMIVFNYLLIGTVAFLFFKLNTSSNLKLLKK